MKCTIYSRNSRNVGPNIGFSIFSKDKSIQSCLTHSESGGLYKLSCVGTSSGPMERTTLSLWAATSPGQMTRETTARCSVTSTGKLSTPSSST